MAGMPNERIISPIFDRRGNPEWRSTMSPPDDSIAVVKMIPDRIIPVIFVPGVMGSNLKGIGESTNVQWRLDSAASAGQWALPKYNAEYRRKHLTPTTMVVDDEGALPTDTSMPAKELKRRGWGEVGALSYATFLSWLENALNDFDNPQGGLRVQLVDMALGATKGEQALVKDAVALSYRYRFVVHACGYNWLDDNAVASRRLKGKINAVVKRYRDDKLHDRKAAGCLAHARRKFDELIKDNQSPVALQAVQRIAWIYRIEREVQGLTVSERLAVRQARSKPLWEEMHVWLQLERQRVPNGSGIAGAIDYSLNHWAALTANLRDGNVAVDNNHAENQMRPWAIGRKSWLFASSELAGQRAAVVMSLVASAKLNGHDPWADRKDVLTRLPTQPNGRIEELLPHLWTPPASRLPPPSASVKMPPPDAY